MLCGSLEGKGVWEWEDIGVCVAESLCCVPETITTLLISYNPIRNKQLKKEDRPFRTEQQRCLCCKSGDCIHVSLFLDSVSFPLYPLSRNQDWICEARDRHFPRCYFREDTNAFALVEFFGFFSPTYFPSLYKDKGVSSRPGTGRNFLLWILLRLLFLTEKKTNNIKFNMSLNPISRKQSEITWMPVELVFCIIHNSFSIFLKVVDQSVKNLPAMQETWVPSLGWEDPLKEGMASHSSILAWRIPMDKGAWWATVHGVAKRHDWATKHSTHSLKWKLWQTTTSY